MTLHHPSILNVLQQVSTDRLQKAINALADGSLSITITRQTDTEVRALVKNGEGKSYGVTLSESGAFCSCLDALYRGSTCKHITIVALFTLRQLSKAPQQEHRLALHVGSRVQQLGNPQKQGRVVCVSGEIISVWWDGGRTEPCEKTSVAPHAM